MLVWGIPALGDDTFPTLATGARPRLGIVDQIDVPQRRAQRQLAQPVAPLFERQRPQVPIHPRDVEDVVELPSPGHLSVEDHLARRQRRHGARNRRTVLRQPIPGIQPDVVALLEGEQADAVELALEQPVRAGKAFLCQRCRHGDDPVGKSRASEHPSDSGALRAPFDAEVLVRQLHAAFAKRYRLRLQTSATRAAFLERRRTADRIFKGALIFNTSLTVFWLVMLATGGHAFFFGSYDVSLDAVGRVLGAVFFFYVLWGFIWYGIKSLLLTYFVGSPRTSAARRSRRG